jgi:hypothetical protein
MIATCLHDLEEGSLPGAVHALMFRSDMEHLAALRRPHLFPLQVLLDDVLIGTQFKVVYAANLVHEYEKVAEEYRGGVLTNVRFLGIVGPKNPEFDWLPPDITEIYV